MASMFHREQFTRPRELSVALGACLLALTACSADKPSDSHGAGGTTPGSGAARAAGGSGGAAASSGSATAAAGSGGRAGNGAPMKANPGSTENDPCSPPEDTTRTCCGKGVQSCMGDDEFPIWGPCADEEGSPVSCTGCGEDEFGGCDAGMPPPPDAGEPPPQDAGEPPDKCGPGMECKPGSVRYCDMFALDWSVADCDATGHWGDCVATTIPAAADGEGCAQDDYAPELCCGVAKICCQNSANGPFLDYGSGACAAVNCP